MTNPRKQSVLNIGHFYHVKGGSDRYMLSLERLLSQNGHSVVPYASNHPANITTPWDRYFPSGIDTRKPSLKSSPRYVFSVEARQKLKMLLSETQIDVAHLHIYYGQLTASILDPIRAAGIPIVQTLHDYKLTCATYNHLSNGRICEACNGGHFWHAIPRSCKDGSIVRTLASVLESYVSRLYGSVRLVQHFIAPSRFMKALVVKHRVVPPKRVSVIHNFVWPQGEPPADIGEYLLYFGRLSHEKGLTTLLDAVGGLSTPVYLVGEGPQRAELQIVAGRRHATNIKFLGFQSADSLQRLIRNSACVIVPSEGFENCPMSILESMAFSRPVIASRIGGIPELVRHGDNGLLFEPGNAKELRDAVQWALGHKRSLREMSLRARERAEQEFSPEIHYRKLRAVYDEVGE